uniref:Heme-binding protein n=1 Tax=Anaerolinea thermolimosa TaxID=229919 RepID=A0A7C4PKN5_9CHLR
MKRRWMLLLICGARLAGQSQLTAQEAEALALRAVGAVDNPAAAAVVVDRAGRVLAAYRRAQAADLDLETALALARTGAFFSHDQAPLSSRTIQTLSQPNFPAGVPNQPAAALFGIEHTNRGCGFNAEFDAGKELPPARNFAGDGPSLGVVTRPGGLPLYKGGSMVGGIGVGGMAPEHAEFAAVSAAAGAGFFVPLPLPFPGAVFIDGIRLPFVEQTSQPAGTRPAAALDGGFVGGSRDGQAAPEGWLISPRGSGLLGAEQVRAIIERAVARAERTRGVIRLPLGSRSRMVLAVSDVEGNVLGLFRMPDATVFSADVAVAKARNVVYFSSTARQVQDLPGLPVGVAVTNRSIGFGAQPFFPSGIQNSEPGPFRALFEFDRDHPCTQGWQPANPNQNGIVFFPGSAPLYRNGALVGGLGVSGDGVEQDDYVTAAGAEGFEPPPGMRADEYFIRGVRIPYWKFPRNPER